MDCLKESQKKMYLEILKSLLKKVGGLIVPDAKEIKLNNRARSAKLRIAEKLNSK